MAETRRSIVREHRFEDELHELIADPEQADEFVAAAEYVLSENPRLGVLAEGGPPEVWLLPMAPIGAASVALLYTFDESTVWFLSIRPYYN